MYIGIWQFKRFSILREKWAQEKVAGDFVFDSDTPFLYLLVQNLTDMQGNLSVDSSDVSVSVHNQISQFETCEQLSTLSIKKYQRHFLTSSQYRFYRSWLIPQAEVSWFVLSAESNAFSISGKGNKWQMYWIQKVQFYLFFCFFPFLFASVARFLIE